MQNERHTSHHNCNDTAVDFSKLQADEQIAAENANQPVEEVEIEALDIASSGVAIEKATESSKSLSRVYCQPKHLDRLALLTSIATAAYAGVALRLGIIAYFTYIQPASFLYAVAWTNFLGSFIMGLLTDHKAALAKFYAPLVIAVLTGFCGSLTSFSTVIVSGATLTFGLAFV